jgi:Holliday junction resolvasome RuvABC DNA-binding subunit
VGDPSKHAQLRVPADQAKRGTGEDLRTQAMLALRGLGWSAAIASAAVASAATNVGAEPTLEQLIFAALRACPRPRAA